MQARTVAHLTVACIRWGDKYGDEYVLKLRNMCARHVPDHAFVCFTDQPVEGVYCRELPSNLPTWWSKLGLFKPGVLTGDVLYLDLDVVITGALDGLVGLLEDDRTGLWALDDFSYSLIRPRTGLDPALRRMLGGAGTVNSSVMLWHGDTCRAVWDKFQTEKMDELHGDQNWITQALWPEGIRLIPQQWASSYKYGGKGVIRVFHGLPKPDHVTDLWVHECWR